MRLLVMPQIFVARVIKSIEERGTVDTRAPILDLSHIFCDFFSKFILTEQYKDKLRTICNSYLLKRRLHHCPINGWSRVSPCLDDLWFTCKGFALSSQRMKYFYTVEITTAQFPALPWLKSSFPAKSIPKNRFFFSFSFTVTFSVPEKACRKCKLIKYSC